VTQAIAAYKHQFTNWPIIAGVAAVYAILGAVRRMFDFGPMMDLIFLVISIAAIYGCRALYNSGVQAHNSNYNNNNNNYPPGNY
jgi:hypothetical protein